MRLDTSNQALLPGSDRLSEMSEIEIIRLAFGRLRAVTDAELSLLTAEERSELALWGRQILAKSAVAPHP